jgi:predicted nuclease of predicted toxin-antitoxin system
MKLLIDMNLSPRWVATFTAASIQSVHWSAVGSLCATDAEIMTYAKAHDFVVITHDLDFGNILASTHAEKPSVVQIRAENITPEAIATPVIAALRQMAAELEDGALVTIDPLRTRLRMLPLPHSK